MGEKYVEKKARERRNMASAKAQSVANLWFANLWFGATSQLLHWFERSLGAPLIRL
ncbi:MAG: hypothetical protein LBK73_02300 [Treponema sp.]|jgi:hypothetical protein|nr:hypothetical protein [Treponema sp.]